jgi:hypothetical protein
MLLSCLIAACVAPTRPAGGKRLARVTYYCRQEDKKLGSRRADGGRIEPGITIAASKTIPFGTRVEIPALTPIFGDPSFVVQDRGSAVESRKASRGMLEVLDVAVPDKKEMHRLAMIMNPVLDFEFITAP